MAGTNHGEFMMLDGALVPFTDAKVHVLAPAMTFAAAVFEGIRAYWNSEQAQLHVFRLDDHLSRLQYSMRVMRFDSPPDTQTLRRSVIELLRANAPREDTYLRVQVYIAGDGSMGATGPLGMFVSCTARGRSPLAETGCRVAVSGWTRIADNATPARVKGVANYVNGRLATIQAKQDGYDGALILTTRGTVAEGPGSCLFIRRGTMLITPDVADGILESVTRDTLIWGASQWLGHDVEQRPIGRTELYAADEAFLCGTGAEILPIIAIDGLPVGAGTPGPITTDLQRHYFDLVAARDPAQAEWRTPVYEEKR